jgi:hypothetical protein
MARSALSSIQEAVYMTPTESNQSRQRLCARGWVGDMARANPASLSAIWGFWQAQVYGFGSRESIRRAKRRRCAAVMSSNPVYA